ncbi:L-fucose/L-arabinose isomerase family protein [Flexithrix dorotheae]|uniref:L-fucose/L-arabinose isomerase family protein n=1 Tax=Flexithrix dorotheae TaxID=70993 RepID=UPI00036F814A|nr:L-fucose/L-arabinose isomerase family protein [Flexithrix dorotheae]
MAHQITLGVIIGNRDFFPDILVTEARKDLVELAKKIGINLIMVNESETKLGGVETFQEARTCADLFRKNADKIDGILVCLPNFGDEKGVADAIRLSDLKVPILIQGYPDELGKMHVERRRDAFCGKISVCNNLKQYGIPYSITHKHVVHPSDPDFEMDLQKFIGVCRVVRGLTNLRIGAVGARPGAFNTVRYSEKILERNGISVTTVDLSEILGNAEKLGNEDAKVKEKLDAIKAYSPTGKTPGEKLVQMAKMGVVLSDFMEANSLDATAIQCWTSVQENYGCNVCTNMSMMSDQLMPSACEVDVTGTLTMYAMQLASGSPSALVDWNNNYAADENKCVLFHCGNWAKSFLPDIQIGTAPILGTIVGEENTYGALEGRTPAGLLTYGRISTFDSDGNIRAYFGEGMFTNDELKTFGNRAVASVPKLQKLMRYICNNGFEHHAVMNASHTAGILQEALEKYLNWDVYYHNAPEE